MTRRNWAVEQGGQCCPAESSWVVENQQTKRQNSVKGPVFLMIYEPILKDESAVFLVKPNGIEDDTVEQNSWR